MYNKIIILLLIVSTLVLSSCEKWLDINDDPEQATEIPAELAIPAAEGQIAGSLSGEYSIFGGIWSQHWTQHNNSSQYKAEDSYNISGADYNNEWDLLFSDALIDLQLAREKAVEEENWNVNLQAVALSSFTFQILTDLYGSIPYSQALEGGNTTAPAFDDGQIVYDGLISELDEALSVDLTAVTNSYNTSDLVFGNAGSAQAQISAWEAFANTLKLKLYLRQIEARPDVARQGIMDLINSGATFLTSVDAAITTFQDADSKSFPLYETDRRQLNTANNLRGSYTLVTYLNANSDPRVSSYFEPSSSGEYVGILNGSYDVPSADLPPASHSRVALSPTQPFFFFSKEEVHFMLAEAYLRVMNEETTAKQYYDQGVLMAMQRYNADGASFISGGGVYEFPTGGSMEEQMKTIMMQKWVAYVYRGYESYLEQNRTGFPEVAAISSYPCDVGYGEALTGNSNCDPSYEVGNMIVSYTSVLGANQLPKRLIYPDSEINVNPEAPDRLSITEPVWWNVK